MKTFSEHSDLQEQEYKQTASIIQRRKLARRMRMLSKQSGFQMKKNVLNYMKFLLITMKVKT